MIHPLKPTLAEASFETIQQFDLAVSLFGTTLCVNSRKLAGHDGRPQLTLADLQGSIDAAASVARGALGVDPRGALERRTRIETLLSRIRFYLCDETYDDEAVAELDELTELIKQGEGGRG